jgi:hypothetical protein
MQAGFSRRTVTQSWDDAAEIQCPQCQIARLVAKVNGLGPANVDALFELLAKANQ